MEISIFSNSGYFGWSGIILKWNHPRIGSVFPTQLANGCKIYISCLIGRRYYRMKSNHIYFSANRWIQVFTFYVVL